ncbi:unnamed protein product [Dicrocoelium dendriticum]|nr:unnamed protein product [Dicrocoelium dendriticum]
MKPFLRFLTRREADELGAKLLRELQLRSELEQLYEYRKRGVRQMSDIHLRSMVPLVAEPLVATSGGAVRSRRPAFFKSGSHTRTMYSTFGRIKKIRTAARRRAVKGGHLRRRL